MTDPMSSETLFLVFVFLRASKRALRDNNNTRNNNIMIILLEEDDRLSTLVPGGAVEFIQEERGGYSTVRILPSWIKSNDQHIHVKKMPIRSLFFNSSLP